MSYSKEIIMANSLDSMDEKLQERRNKSSEDFMFNKEN